MTKKTLELRVMVTYDTDDRTGQEVKKVVGVFNNLPNQVDLDGMIGAKNADITATVINAHAERMW